MTGAQRIRKEDANMENQIATLKFKGKLSFKFHHRVLDYSRALNFQIELLKGLTVKSL